MTFMKKRDGFTLLELLVVIGIAGVLLAIGGTLATKFVARHSTDNVTRTISSTLQLMKLKAAREGVEYQAILTFDSSKNTLTILTQKGNSNRGSTNYTDEASQIINLSDTKVTISMTPTSGIYNFNPNGTISAAGGPVNINPADGVGGKRCGIVCVGNWDPNHNCVSPSPSPLGRISIVEGTWNSSSSSCSPVY